MKKSLDVLTTEFGDIPGLGDDTSVVADDGTVMATSIIGIVRNFKKTWLYLTIPTVAGVLANKVVNIGHIFRMKKQAAELAEAKVAL